jgi:hypothetical protein
MNPLLIFGVEETLITHEVTLSYKDDLLYLLKMFVVGVTP